MTTKFLDYNICTFINSLSWRVPGEPVFWTIFFSAPIPPLLKNAHVIYFYCRLDISEKKLIHNRLGASAGFINQFAA